MVSPDLPIYIAKEKKGEHLNYILIKIIRLD